MKGWRWRKRFKMLLEEGRKQKGNDDTERREWIHRCDFLTDMEQKSSLHQPNEPVNSCWNSLHKWCLFVHIVLTGSAGKPLGFEDQCSPTLSGCLPVKMVRMCEIVLTGLLPEKVLSPRGYWLCTLAQQWIPLEFVLIKNANKGDIFRNGHRDLQKGTADVLKEDRTAEN